MRKIKEIIIHCSATPPSMDIGAKEIRDWHVNFNGWSDIGYHDIIRRNGRIEEGRPLSRIGAHCKGHNRNSIGICLVGGTRETRPKVPENNFTVEQFKSLQRLLGAYSVQYPDAKIYGHNEFSSKACPSFDVQEWLSCVVIGDGQWVHA